MGSNNILIGKLKMKLKIQKIHPHMEKCEGFRRALGYGLIIVIDNEPQIMGKLPETTKVGNLLTGEKYNSDNFMLNLVINFCPFCSERIFEEKIEEGMEF